MNRPRRSAILIALTGRLRELGSWSGETHVQKSVYFLQELVGVPLDFNFLLYKHGPFSFDLRDELTLLRADGLLDLEPRPYPYGPTLVVSKAGRELENRYSETLKPYTKKVDFIADRLSSKRVGELESLATALFVKKSEPGLAPESRARKIVEYKPHVEIDKARDAVSVVESFSQEALSLSVTFD